MGGKMILIAFVVTFFGGLISGAYLWQTWVRTLAAKARAAINVLRA